MLGYYNIVCVVCQGLFPVRFGGMGSGGVEKEIFGFLKISHIFDNYFVDFFMKIDYTN